MGVSLNSIVPSIRSWLSGTSNFFIQPARILRSYESADLRLDLIAGLTLAVVLLPQAIAYALIAELPAQVGLYTAVLGSIAAALWGSSKHLHTGPTNAASLLVLTTLLPLFAPGSAEFIIAASMMALLAGLFKLLLGIFRIGFIVNFVADSVIIGFAAGAGVLIVANQLRPLLRISTEPSSLFFVTLYRIFRQVGDLHWLSLALGLFTLCLLILFKKYRPKWPRELLAMSLAALLVYVFKLDQHGIQILGAIPQGFPPFKMLPIFDFKMINSILAGALAAAIIGLVEALSIGRAIAQQTGQRIDTNQEFVGQGLSSVITAFFGGYPSSGSFTRSAMNYGAGGRTQLAGVFSGLWVLLATLFLAPLIGYLPRAALAGVLIFTAINMIDRAQIRHTLRSSVGDSYIMLATFAAALFAPLQYAVLTGVFVSFVRYINQTATIGVPSVLPDEAFTHFEERADQPVCPQLSVMTIQGSLYFGATNHVEDAIRNQKEVNPDQKFLLLRMHHVNHIDMTGIHMLETITQLFRRDGGDVFMTRVTEPVMERMIQTGFDQVLGDDHFLAVENAIRFIFNRVLDPSYCIYSCEVRAWRECQSLPKSHNPNFVPLYEVAEPHVDVPHLLPNELAALLDADYQLMLIDVRELDEWVSDGFIPDSQNIPLPKFYKQNITPPPDCMVVFISRTGRRSRHLVGNLHSQGRDNVFNLKGGILGWRSSYLPVEVLHLPQDKAL